MIFWDNNISILLTFFFYFIASKELTIKIIIIIMVFFFFLHNVCEDRYRVVLMIKLIVKSYFLKKNYLLFTFWYK